MSTDGCWVQFFDGEKFGGATIRFEGPINVADMDDYVQSDGRKAGDEPDSLKTGSRAWIEVYKDDDYKNTSKQFGPNSLIGDLGEYDMGGKISSFKLYAERPAWFSSSVDNTLIESNYGGISSQTVNNFFRSAAGAVVSMVPYVGGALRSVLYAIWPEQRHTDQVWACFQNFVNEVVAGVTTQKQIANLSKTLDGLYKETKAYVNALPEEKKNYFTALESTLRAEESFFIDTGNPATTVMFAIPFGTLALATMAEDIVSHEQIYGVPLDPQTRQERITNLRNKIAEYQNALAEARQGLLSARNQMLQVTKDGGNYFVIDAYNGWRSIAYGDSTSAQHERDKQGETVVNQLAYKLDQTMAVSQLWAWFDPSNTTPVRPPTIVYCDGPYGTYQSTAFDSEAGSGAVTKIVISTGSLVDSIELFVDGASTGPHGGKGGAPSALELAAGETIVSARGYATGLINQIGFTSSSGRSILGGTDGGVDVRRFTSAAPAGTTDGRLVGISGYSDNGTTSNANLKVITFHWGCALPMPDISTFFPEGFPPANAARP